MFLVVPMSGNTTTQRALLIPSGLVKRVQVFYNNYSDLELKGTIVDIITWNPMLLIQLIVCIACLF